MRNKTKRRGRGGEKVRTDEEGGKKNVGIGYGDPGVLQEGT